MPFDIVRVDLPDSVVRLSFGELRAVLTDMENPYYPNKITLFCDECSKEVSVEVVVTDADSSVTRLEMGRAYLRSLGWRTDETGDFCPKDKKEQE